MDLGQTLMKTRDKIKPLLVEMFPDCEDAIQFQYEDGFQEWFGMLFTLKDWKLTPKTLDIADIQMSKSKTRKSEDELFSYEGLEDFGIISVVLMEGEFHLIDGYHRTVLAKQRGLLQLEGCVWEKVSNNHENCTKIRTIIINGFK